MLPSSVAEVGETYGALVDEAVVEALALLAQVLRRGYSSPEAWRDAVQSIGDRLLALQVGVATMADPYLNDVLEEGGLDPSADSLVVPTAWADQGDGGGSWLQSLVFAPNSLREPGVDWASHFDFVANSIVKTGITDTARSSVQTGMQARRSALWYVRMLKGKSCARCAVLAGRKYRSQHAFDRHRRCDCIHIPAGEDANDWTVNPKKYFAGLAAEEQDRLFTKAGAQAIRDGADINQVVNARRGANGLTPAGARLTNEEAQAIREGRDIGRLQRIEVFGQQVYVTNEGTTVRGLAGKRLADRGLARPIGQRYRRATTPRLMPESIYELAENREDAVRLLRRYGYLI
jgi:hypothetical protein